jgi:hypothetical protein
MAESTAPKGAFTLSIQMFIGGFMRKIVFAAAAAALVLSGCANQRFTMAGGAVGAAKTDDAQTFFVSGLGQSTTVDAAAVCGGADKVVAVETQLTFLDGLLGGLTGGIYTPRHARVYCK